MKGIVPLSIMLAVCIELANSEAGSKYEQPKQNYNNANTISSTPKPDLLSYQQITQHFGNKVQPQQLMYHEQYQPRTQQLQQAVPYNHQPDLIRKHLPSQYQQSPVAMVIIAQPAYIPASMLQQGNVAQQLLQYFQGNNVQSRYQYVPANHQPFYQQQYQSPVQTQQYVQQQQQQENTHFQTSAPAPPVAQAQNNRSPFAAHEALPTPQALSSQQQNLRSQTTSEGRNLRQQYPQDQIQYQSQQSEHIEQHQDADISKLAQQAAQHFLSNGALNSATKTAPAIITGLEHFSPEQQEKIKAQLSEHFGSPLKPLEFEGKEYSQEHDDSFPSRDYYPQYTQKFKRERFVPSLQVKDGEIKQTYPSGGDL